MAHTDVITSLDSYDYLLVFGITNEHSSQLAPHLPLEMGARFTWEHSSEEIPLKKAISLEQF